MPPKIALPPLAFSAMSAWEETDAERMSERLSGLGTARMAYRPRNKGAPFRSLSAHRKIGTLMLSANSCSEVEYTASNINQSILIIPMVGKGKTRQDKREVEWDSAHGGAIAPRADTFGFSTRRSLAGVSLDEVHLEQLARHMLGIATQAPVLDFETPRALPYALGGVRFDFLFRHLIAAIDECVPEPRLMDLSGLDDAFNRIIVMWLKPEAFFESKLKITIRRPGFDDACDYILANLGRKITLTDLETVSGMSPRLLQYTFRERFGRSPLQWAADRRLDEVRSELLKAPPRSSVSMIAAQYFGNLGDFSLKYKKKFGEAPSQTMSRRRDS